MNDRAAAAEEAVVAAALRQGLLTPAQLEMARRTHGETRRAGRPSSLLALLATHFRPADREALRRVYAAALEAGGAAADDADAEATAVLDMPVPPPPPGTTHGSGGPGGPGPTSGGASGPVRLIDPLLAATGGPGAAAAPRPVTAESTASAPPPGVTVADAHPPIAQTAVVGPPGATLAAPPAIGGAPTEVAGFTISRELGRGGMGVVYEATHARHGAVALKVLLAGDLATSEDVERFKLEAKASSSLDHPNVVRVLEHGQDALGRWFMAMELVEGESLEAIVRREGPLPTLEAARVARDVARALAAAHARSILHRDVKPHNVLMDGDTPRLTDFGLAKLTGDAKSRSLTASGPGVLGTPAYMAPEQAGGERKRVDVRADVYGVGSLLYHLLTGRAPFDGDSLASVLVAVLQKAPAPPSQRRPGLPRDLETICLKCLEKEPDNRYPTAAALADDLDRFVRAEEIAARPPGALLLAARAARKSPVTTTVGLAGALALVVGVGLGVRASGGRDVGNPVASATEPAPPAVALPSPPPAPEPTAATPPQEETTQPRPPATIEPAPAAPTATEPGPVTTTEPKPEPATEPRPATATEPATEPATESKPATEPATEPKPEPKPEPEPATEPKPEPEPSVAVRPPAGEPPEPPPATASTHTPEAEAEGAPLDPSTIEWLTARGESLRLLAQRGAAPRLTWAPSLAAGLREAQARQVPLLVVLLGFGDELPAPLRDPALLAALNEHVVAVLGQKRDKEEKDKRSDEKRIITHEQVEVDGQVRCARESQLTCDQHHDVQKRLKSEDPSERVIPGDALELADKEDCRLLFVLPAGVRVAALSDEPEKTGLPGIDATNLTRALIEARAGAGAPALPFDELKRLGEAQAWAHEVKDVSRAVGAYRKLARDRRATDLVRRFAEHQLDDGLVARVDALIARIMKDSASARRELRALRGEVRDLPRCVERIEAALLVLD